MNTASIIVDTTHPTLAHAKEELQAFLEKTTNFHIADDSAHADYCFVLATDAGLRDTSYAVAVSESTGPTQVTLSGHDEACVLHAVYEMLETCGVCFDILAPLLPEQLDLSALAGGSQVIVPFVKKRGIRQHINFAMDMSSYPLDEALNYVRNLARLRMNHITFHSYSGQWFGYAQDGTYKHGGNFFYGTRFELPKDDLFRRHIRNRAVYCIPEIELAIDRPEERSRLATEWLNAVIAECKRCGMHVQLSIEPPGHTVEDGVEICREVLSLYPAVDTLELITPECGGGAPRPLKAEDIGSYLIELFGHEVLQDPALTHPFGGDLGQLEGGLRHCARNIRIVEALRADPTRAMPALAIGAYITCPDTLRILHAVMSRYAPRGVSLAFLPAHGARRAVTNLRQAGVTSESMSRSMLYGWIEFDGNMYVQQNSVVGARQMLEFAKELTGSAQVEGVALNHWRTAENRACIAYAAKAFIRGPIAPGPFYKAYATAFGLADTGRYARIMQELDDLDDLAREKMFNIGFCASGCWVRPGLRWTLKWDNGSIDTCRQRFRNVIRELQICLQSATQPAGRDLLRFLINRVECTVLQLDCAQKMKSLSAFCNHDDPGTLSPEQKQTVITTCDGAMEMVRGYLEKHAEAIRDRGCEGTLISYQTTMPNFINHVRTVFVDGETVCTHFLPQFDEPPPPMIN